jgi:hypothetical protein
MVSLKVSVFVSWTACCIRGTGKGRGAGPISSRTYIFAKPVAEVARLWFFGGEGLRASARLARRGYHGFSRYMLSNCLVGCPATFFRRFTFYPDVRAERVPGGEAVRSRFTGGAIFLCGFAEPVAVVARPWTFSEKHASPRFGQRSCPELGES